MALKPSADVGLFDDRLQQTNPGLHQWVQQSISAGFDHEQIQLHFKHYILPKIHQYKASQNNNSLQGTKNNAIDVESYTLPPAFRGDKNEEKDANGINQPPPKKRKLNENNNSNSNNSQNINKNIKPQQSEEMSFTDLIQQIQFKYIQSQQKSQNLENECKKLQNDYKLQKTAFDKNKENMDKLKEDKKQCEEKMGLMQKLHAQKIEYHENDCRKLTVKNKYLQDELKQIQDKYNKLQSDHSKQKKSMVEYKQNTNQKLQEIARRLKYRKNAYDELHEDNISLKSNYQKQLVKSKEMEGKLKEYEDKNEKLRKKLGLYNGTSEVINTMNLEELNKLEVELQNGVKNMQSARQRLLVNEYKCIACYDNKKNVLFIDGCDHISYCDSCEKKNVAPKTCPICQRPYTQTRIIMML